MKLRSSLHATAASALALAILSASPARADLKAAARHLHDESNAALVGIKGLLKIDATMNGQPAGNQESPIWGNGLVIGDGLVVTAYQTLVPDVSAQAKGAGGLPAGLEIKTKLNEVKFVDGAGEEYDAKLILHDEDLDLAFLSLDPKADNAADWAVAPIGITGDPAVQLLDDVISLGRQSATLRFTSVLKTGTVISIVERPRLLYAVEGISPGAPAFAASGEFLGLVTVRKSVDNKQGSVAVILPAKYIRKLLPQAQEKQEALAKGELEEAEEKPAPATEGDGEAKTEEGDAAPVTPPPADETPAEEEPAQP